MYNKLTERLNQARKHETKRDYSKLVYAILFVIAYVSAYIYLVN